MSNVLDGRRPSYVSIKTLCAELEIGESTVYALVRSGVLPKPLKLSPGCVRWRWESVVLALHSLAEGAAGIGGDDDPIMQRIHEHRHEMEAKKEAKIGVPQKRKRAMSPSGKE